MSQITKKALEASLKKLLLKKPLNKITINDITEDCGINRMTFYYHFKDIYDLVEWVCIQDASEALDEKKTYETWEQGFVQIFFAVRENRPFIMNVYRCVSRERVEKYLAPLADELIRGVIEEKAQGMQVLEADKRFIAKVYGYDVGMDRQRYERRSRGAGRSSGIGYQGRCDFGIGKIPDRPQIRLKPYQNGRNDKILYKLTPRDRFFITGGFLLIA